MTLPEPGSVASRASRTEPTGEPTPNVAVSGAVNVEAVERVDGGYAGDTVGALGRLAAAVSADVDAALHYPEPVLTAEGPWLVLAPLSGFVSTVSTGVGRVTVVLDDNSDTALRRLEDRLSALFEAARPSHDHYPVTEDSRGVFTGGMTTFALDSVSTDGHPTVTFDASTTPATRPSEVEARFSDVTGVKGVEYEPVVGVERAEPSPGLREAVEAAHRRELGDCEYEWLRSPGLFAGIPGSEKVALGTGDPGSTEFTSEQYETCIDLLESALSALEVDA